MHVPHSVSEIDTIQTGKKIRMVMDLRTKGIRNMDVLGAMERIPRDLFVPEAVKDQAWEDMALPIGCGQTISQPFIVAAMTQALEISDRDKILEIGTGCGYQTAVLAKLCRRVYSIERHKPLLEMAEEKFRFLKTHNITAIAADGMLGWPTIGGIDQAPFDKIMVTAAARDRPPAALIEQLKEGGLMIIPVHVDGEQVLRLYRRDSAESYSYKDLMMVRFVPLLPEVAGVELSDA